MRGLLIQEKRWNCQAVPPTPNDPPQATNRRGNRRAQSLYCANGIDGAGSAPLKLGGAPKGLRPTRCNNDRPLVLPSGYDEGQHSAKTCPQTIG
jgi:hypothetical protein